MSTRPERETAYRVFAAEFEDSNLSYAESDEERAPNYVVTPTGARVNRLFVVGVLTEIEALADTQLRARVVDPTGAFVIYAGQYQPEALSFLEDTTPPKFVAVTGKARTFQPEDSERVFTSIRPETLNEVDAETRDRFTVDVAVRTRHRVETMREALARAERDDELRAALEDEDVEIGVAAGIPRAIAHYGTTTAYLDATEEMALDAARVVAGEREEVSPLGVTPDEGATEHTPATDTDTTSATAIETDEGPPTSTPTSERTTESTTETEPDSGTESDSETRPRPGAGTPDDGVTADEIEAPGDAESAVEAEPGDDSSADEIDGANGEVPPEAGGEGSDAAPETEAVDLDDPGEFELSADERERVEDEYGTDFETAGEVDGPGEADIETPLPEIGDGSAPSPETEGDDSRTDETDETDPTTTVDTPEPAGGVAGEAAVGDEERSEVAEPRDDDDADTEPSETDESPSAEANEPTEADFDSDSDADGNGGSSGADIDPEEAVVAAMHDLDEGAGANREAVTERVAEEYGLTPAEADDGIQEALMSGECYEPDDDTLKPI